MYNEASLGIHRIKVLILVKTYPVLSQTYGELVCTAGLTSTGKWIRLYPLPFRLLSNDKQFSKYQWIEVDVQRKEDDFRPESYRIVNTETIVLLNTIDTAHLWRERKKFLYKHLSVHCNISQLIESAQKENSLSLAFFKPKKILDFVIENSEKDWAIDRMESSYNAIHQRSLFDSEEEKERRRTFEIVKKIPYKFSYRFIDENDTECKLMIEDWELGQLYWNYVTKRKESEKVALAKIRNKYYTDFLKTDTHFFLGTTKKYHGWANNPFIIIGVFYPPKENQIELDFFD